MASKSGRTKWSSCQVLAEKNTPSSFSDERVLLDLLNLMTLAAKPPYFRPFVGGLEPEGHRRQRERPVDGRAADGPSRLNEAAGREPPRTEALWF